MEIAQGMSKVFTHITTGLEFLKVLFISKGPIFQSAPKEQRRRHSEKPSSRKVFEMLERAF